MTNLSRAGLCLFHRPSQREVQSRGTSSHQGVSIDGGIVKQEKHLLIRPLQVQRGISASFQEKHLAQQSSCSGRPARPPALPCLAAGGPCGSLGNEVTYELACATHPPSLACVPCSMRCCFQMCSQGTVMGFFLSPLFLPGLQA